MDIVESNPNFLMKVLVDLKIQIPIVHVAYIISKKSNKTLLGWFQT